MKNLLVITFILLNISLKSQSDEWLTIYEKSDFLATSTYHETIDFCKKLDSVSPIIHFESFGISPQGRELPLMIIDKRGNTSVEAIKASGNIILMIQCGIHSGEIEGKDAMMMLLRDIAVTHKNLDLLDHITILWIPIFNVDGHERSSKFSRINQNGPEEMGWRTTAQNLNLNRDYVKAEAPEMKAWHQLFNRWLPDFFIDSHTTDGADYQYVLTYGIEVAGSLDPGLTEWEIEQWAPFVTEKMENAGFPIYPYISFQNWHDPRSGLYYMPSTPKFSTGYLATQNRPAVLIETHMLKPYKIRVESTEELIKLTMQLLNKDHQNFKKLISAADQYVLSENFSQQVYPLEYKTDFSDSNLVEFKGLEYKIVESDLTEGDWFQYSQIPTTFQVELFAKNVPSETAKLPTAYIFPPEWQFIIEKLELHNIHYFKLKNPKTIQVNTYQFTDYTWRQKPFEGRHPMSELEMEEKSQMHNFPAGSVVVEMNQRTARLIAHIFEPQGPDSFVKWGYFDAIFEQKEYAESYVMEPLARQMMEEDPSLKTAFEVWKNANPEQAKKPEALLNWFFQQSPYWDQQKDKYPVCKIMDKTVLNSLISDQ